MRTDTEAALLAMAWDALRRGDDPAPDVDAFEVTGPRGGLPARLPVEELALASVGTALLAASDLGRHRNRTSGRVALDRAHLAAAMRSEQHFRRGAAGAAPSFAPLSKFWRTSDGWVRTHANYRWHRDALLSALGVPADPDAVADVLASRRAVDVEEQVVAAGGVAGAVRTVDGWRTHPQGRAVISEPLIAHEAVEGAPPRSLGAGALPAAGVRVLDLTRVIAGPVCTRYLAALGADVLRLDPPHRPDMAGGDVADTLLGKRSAMVDLRDAHSEALLDELLAGADVIVCGYRPHALDRFGLAADVLVERCPGTVIVYLDAWGHTGPWATRRGFDSIVQVVSGIALIESPDGERPGVLPCQLLDHGTGYLAAAAALDGLRRQAEYGGTHVRRVSLARTAEWLIAAESDSPAPSCTDTGVCVRRLLARTARERPRGHHGRRTARPTG